MHKWATRCKVATVIPGIICFLAVGAAVNYYKNEEIHLNTTGENVVKNSIAAEYQRYHLSRTNLSKSEKARLLTAIQKMKILSLTARGAKESLVVRVEVEQTKAQPPGFSNIHYYQLKYSSLTGWANEGRTTAENYYFSEFNRFYN